MPAHQFTQFRLTPPRATQPHAPHSTASHATHSPQGRRQRRNRAIYRPPGNWAAIPDDAGTDEPLAEAGQQDPDATLRRALSAAPAEGVPVSDLITATGMSRRWVFYRLRQLAADGYAVQTVRGHWRTAR